MKDIFANQTTSLTSPFTYAEPVAPSNTSDLPYASRALYVGVAGDVKVTTVNGSVVTFTNHPVGYLPARVARVHLTGTTAAEIIAVW